MASAQTFNPDWVSPPGETILDLLEQRSLSLEELAESIGKPLDAISAITRGQIAINAEMASSLNRALGPSVEFWQTREAQYRHAQSKMDERAEASIADSWLKELPWKDIAAFGWIPSIKDPRDLKKACLSFFGVEDVEQWRRRYSSVLDAAAFRTSDAYASQPGAVAAWLRYGMVQAEGKDCPPWDPEAFKASLHLIRALTRISDPKIFLPALTKISAACGVVVVVARAPSGCRASGATTFAAPDRALLLLSFRYLTDDQFWFTFFHEAGHLLLHSKERVFLEGSGYITSKEEQEANEFAARILIPTEQRAALSSLRFASTKDVLRFAKQIGISPGIVIGQLQHMGIVSSKRLNGFKRRYRWNV